MDRRRFLDLTLLLGASCAAPRRFSRRYDIVVYGSAPAAVSVAVTAARWGRSVVVIEPTGNVGGLSASGLGATDIGNKAAIGGLAREFYRRVRRHYDGPNAWTRERREEFRGPGHRADEDAAWTFEPHVAEAIFEEFLDDSRVEVVRGERLDLRSGVERRGGEITALRMESGRRFEGRTFIDVSYEGDVLAGAGASYHVGREANAVYGETLNGVQVGNAVKHQFVARVDPYVKPGVASSGLLPGIDASGPGEEGAGDRKVQAYCYRLCATDEPSNRLPWPRPENYVPELYELLLRNFEAGDERLPWHPLGMPNRKTDSNNNFAVSTDFIGMNWDYAEADWPTREKIVRAHESYQKGLMWTLAHHERTPEKVRRHFGSYGLCRDEFVDHGGWPRQLYVREARRLIGDYVMTEAHCRGQRVAERSVGLAAYTMDSHNVQRYVGPDGAVRNEGDVQVGGFAPYPIDYFALLPRRDQCRNLLAPVCLSASHIAYGSIRMEPVFMVLGESAAIAACLAQERRVELHDLDYRALRERLEDAGQVLDWRG